MNRMDRMVIENASDHKEKTFNFPSWQEGREGVELLAVIPQVHHFLLDFVEHLLEFEISRIYFFDKAGLGF